MVLAKSKQNAGLGRTLINDKQKSAQKARESARSGKTPKHTTDTHNEPNWVKLQSITQERALDEFLSTAELAGTEFTAERKNIKIIASDATSNPYLLTPQQEKDLKQRHKEKRSALRVPRRPAWDSDTTPAELERLERDSFLEWRRGLAQLQESDELLLTPFERNLEVWRQLWRVIERSDLVVQIVDARNPLLFRTEDLEKYVLEVDPDKSNLLLVNKADLMTLEQRQRWAEWFESQGIRFAFYSARLAKEAQENGQQTIGYEDKSDDEVEKETNSTAEDLAEEVDSVSLDAESSDEDEEPSPPPQPSIKDNSLDPRTRILTVYELQSLFLRESPPPKGTLLLSSPNLGHDPVHPNRVVVGLVGYPNVGKSSTINSLLGEKRVSVSSTPGKTKHFQTIHLPSSSTEDDGVILCDCPGLVFPNFASTKAELVCNGVLPIDQLREWTGPAGLLAQRIPREVFEQVYSFKVYSKSDNPELGQQGVTGTNEVARGFTKAGHQGNPDDARAARILLKDFVNGKILYCHPPPGISPEEFNEGHYTPTPIARKSLNPNAPAVADERTEMDTRFFREDGPKAMTRNGVFLGRNLQYGFQKSVGDDGRVLTRKERKLREEMGLGPEAKGKKHFKGRGKK